MRGGLVVVLTSAVVLCGAAVALPAEPPAVRAALVAQQRRVEAGGTVLIGARLELDPGWHVYWKNPGEAGLSTHLSVELPEGFAAGPVRWPVPVAFTQPGEIAGYGYEGSVLLAFEVSAPAGMLPDALPVRVSVSWLACKDHCVLGEAVLEGDLSRLEVDGPAFDRLQRQIPRPSGEGIFTATVSAGSGAGHRLLWLQWQSAPAAVEWFPEPVEGLIVVPARVQTRAGLTRIDIDVRAETGQVTPPSRVRSVVVATDQAGVRRGFVLTLDL